MKRIFSDLEDDQGVMYSEWTKEELDDVKHNIESCLDPIVDAIETLITIYKEIETLDNRQFAYNLHKAIIHLDSGISYLGHAKEYFVDSYDVAK